MAGERWDAVFNFCEGLKGVAREAQAPALLEAYDIPYVFSDPLTLALSLDKAMAKRVVRDLGVPTADFAVIETMADAAKIALPFPLFLKPVAEGSGKGVNARSKVDDAAELVAVAADLLARFAQPVLVETFLSGREFTVGIVGTGEDAHVLGVTEIVPKANFVGAGYGFENKSDGWEDKVDIVPFARARGDGGRQGCPRRLARAALPRRRAHRHSLRRRGRPAFHRGQPAGRIAPGAFRFVLHRRVRGPHLSRPDCRDHGVVLPASYGTGIPAPRGGMMKVLVLHSDVPPDAPPEDQDTLIAAEAISVALISRGHDAPLAPYFPDLEKLRALIAAQAPDVVFNLVEGIEGQGRLAYLAPQMLDALGVAYTGTGAEPLIVTGDKPLHQAHVPRCRAADAQLV